MRNLLMILLLLSFFSCSSKKNDNVILKNLKGPTEVLKINTKNLSLDNRTKLSEISDSIWYVLLESKRESMFGVISKLIVNDKYIIVADFDISQEVFIFNNKGKFISKISKLGKGPFEYARIEDVCFWPQTNTIFIFDGDNKKIIEYDLSGKPLREIIVSFYADNMAILDYNSFVFYVGFRENKGLKYNLLIVNNKGEIVGKSFPIDDRIVTELSKCAPFYYYKEDLYFSPDYESNTYKITKNSIKRKYTLDFMGKNMPVEMIYNKKSKEIDKEISKNKYAYSDVQFESENFVFAQVIAEDFNIFQYIYSKKEKRGKLFNNPLNDLPNSFINTLFVGNIGDVFYGTIDSELLLMIKDDLLKSQKKFPKNNNLINMFLNFKETDNPILCFCRINLSKKSK